MPRYSTILFDADNTLLDFDRSEHEGILDAIRAMGITPSEDMVGVYSAINAAMWKKLERGEVTKAELRTGRFAQFCAHYGLEADPDKFADTYVHYLAQKSYLMEDAVEVCKALAPACRLYIITNGIAYVQEKRFNPSPLRPLFTDVFISEQIGVEKPSKVFFDTVAARIKDFSPADTLVVGDSLTSDIQGGINAGLDTCWLNRKGAVAPADMPITYTISTLRELLPLVLGH